MRPWLKWLLAALRAAGWAPLAVFGAHLLASRVLGTYRAFPSLDVPMHLLGGAAMAHFFRRSLQVPQSRVVVGALTAAAIGLFSMAATGTATVIWEFAEWSSDRLLGSHAQLGLDDTLLDMLLGMAGGLAVLAARVARPAGGRVRGR